MLAEPVRIKPEGENLRVTERCPSCSTEHDVVVPWAGYEKYEAGGLLIQHAFPGLTAAEREQLQSGLCPACQARVFAPPPPADHDPDPDFDPEFDAALDLDEIAIAVDEPGGVLAGLLLHPDRAPEPVEVPNTVRGLQQAVGGGYFERYPLRPAAGPCDIFCDEDGKAKNLPVNALATYLALQGGLPLWPDDIFVGTCLLLGPTVEGESTDLPAAVRAWALVAAGRALPTG